MTEVPMHEGTKSACAALVAVLLVSGCGKDKVGGPPPPPPQLTSPRIAFTSDRGGIGGIHLYNPADGSIVRLTPSGSLDKEPAISPDGLRIAFINSNGRFTRLMTMAVNGTNRTPVLESAQLVPSNPHWSPDSKKLVFTGTRTSGATDVYTILATGDSLSAVTTNGWSRVLAWSPDGSRILYGYHDLSNIATADSLRDVLPSGADTRHVYTTSEPLVGADYSPDGAHIVFDSFTISVSGGYRIQTIDADGSNYHGLAAYTPDIAGLSEPSWSPDGSTIVFSAHLLGGGTSDFYIVTTTPGDAQLLLGGSAVDEDPDWGPKP